tara:strand:+ start:3563 stop:6058 length:2496 start_codon:yes stop_codon:yes gene_type:complete
MKKQNLTEEIYRMRKLMNFDSKEYRDNTTSYDKLFEERLLTQRLISEQEKMELQKADKLTSPDTKKLSGDAKRDLVGWGGNLPNWSQDGKKKWSNGNYKLMIEYVKEYDKLIGGGYINSPWYKIMIQWFEKNDSASSRSSLKNWLFGDVYRGPNVESTKITNKEKRKIKKGKIDPKIFDSFINILGKFTVLLKLPENKKLLNNDVLKKLKFFKDTELPEYKAKGVTFKNSDKTTEFKNKLMCYFIILDWWSKNLDTHNKNKEWYDETGEEELAKYIKNNTQYTSCESLTLEDLNGELSVILTDKGKGVMATIVDVGTGSSNEYQMDDEGLDVSIDADIEVTIPIKKEILFDMGAQFKENWTKKTGQKLDRTILNRIGDIVISDGGSEVGMVSSTEAGGSDFMVKKVGYSPMFQYPPKDMGPNERTKMGMSFFKDDGINLSTKVMGDLNDLIDEAKAQIDEYVKEVKVDRETYIKRVKEGNVTLEDGTKPKDILNALTVDIGDFNLYAFSSTSKVRTKYSKILDKKNIKPIETYLSKSSYNKEGKVDKAKATYTFDEDKAALDSDSYPIPFTMLNGVYSTDKNAETYEAYNVEQKGGFSAKNNEPLAEDRYLVILRYLRDKIQSLIIDSYPKDLVSFDGEITVKSTERNQVKPNMGPEWEDKVTDINTKDPRDGVPYYYDLYKTAWNRNKNLTPQFFYRNRNEDAASLASEAAGIEITASQLKEEYEKTYSPFRNSSAGFDFSLRLPGVTYKPKPDIDKFVVVKNAELSIDVFTNKQIRKGKRWDRKNKRENRKWRWYPGKLFVKGVSWIINQPGGGGSGPSTEHGKCDAYG